jgi:DNA-binding NtrC family response regulator
MRDNKIILIADDESNIVEINSRVVEMVSPNSKIETFSDGESLEKRLNSGGKIDLVITDNNMSAGGITGSDLIAKYGSIYPMVLAYSGEETIALKAIKDGARGYLFKPYSLGKFKEMISGILN